MISKIIEDNINVDIINIISESGNFFCGMYSSKSTVIIE